LAVIPIAALVDVFGQRTVGSTDSTGAARLQLFAPTSARGGLMYTARFLVQARRELKRATLILDPDWADRHQRAGSDAVPDNH
jgi:hypothetical protein